MRRRRSCSSRPDRSRTRGSGRRRSRTCRGTSAWSRSIREETAAPTARGTPDAYSRWEFAEDGRAVLAAAGAETALLGGLCDGGGSALMLAATYPACALGVVRDRAVRPDAHACASALPSVSVRRGARDGRGLGEVQPPLLAARLPRLPRVLLRAAAPRAALDEADRGLRSSGGSQATWRRSSSRPSESGRPWESQEDARAMCERVRCPVLVHARRARRLPAARGGVSRGRATPAGPSSQWKAPATSRRRATR